MNPRMCPLPGRFMFAICVAASLVGAPMLAEDDSVTLTGEIEVAEYDDDGNPTAVMVYDAEWGSVLVSEDGKGAELINHIGAVAKITGTIVELDEENDYAYEIRVSKYTIEEPAEPSEDAGRAGSSGSKTSDQFLDGGHGGAHEAQTAS